MGRAPCCDKANVKKGPWSPEEDAKLKDFMEKFGTVGNWIALPQKAGNLLIYTYIFILSFILSEQLFLKTYLWNTIIVYCALHIYLVDLFF